MSLNLLSSAAAWSTFLNLLILIYWIPASALDWVPTAEEMAKYRNSWNPPTHGTSYTSSADVTRQGQWFVRAYVQGMIGSGESQRTATSQNIASPFSPDAVMPAVTLYYGLTHHVMVGRRHLCSLLAFQHSGIGRTNVGFWDRHHQSDCQIPAHCARS